MPGAGFGDAGAAAPIVEKTGGGEARGTQSFVQILALCWQRPSLMGRELLWRWSFGIPLLVVLSFTGQRIWAETAARLAGTGIFEFSLEYPMQGAVQISDAIDVLKVPVLHVAVWLLPVAMLAWSVAAGLGRSSVLRAYRPETPRRSGAMIALQLLRIVALFGTLVVWWVAIRWAAHFSLATFSMSSDGMGEPNLVLYCALVIVFSLGIFTVWALLSWVFSIAPLLAVLERRGIAGSLVRSLRLGPLRGKLMEINLVMGIVKLALIVLAMVFSATPLPFASVVQGAALYTWWAVVTVLYLVASDFFQVARVVAFVELWGQTAGVGGASARETRGIPLQRK